MDVGDRLNIEAKVAMLPKGGVRADAGRKTFRSGCTPVL